MPVEQEGGGRVPCAATIQRVRTVATLPIKCDPADGDIVLYTGVAPPALYIATAVDTWAVVSGGSLFPWKGAYNPATNYSINDCIQYNGSGYVCIQAGVGHTPDPAGTAFWDLLVLGTAAIAVLPTADLTTTGQTFSAFLAGENMTAGRVVYLKNDGKWWMAAAQDLPNATHMFGIALTAAGVGTALNVALPGGFVKNSGSGDWAWTVGDVLFLALSGGGPGNVGKLTVTPPAGTDYVNRIIGHAMSATVIYFHPDNSWITQV